MSDVEEGESWFYVADSRIKDLGLDASHQWVYWNEGDCFDGVHAPVYCSTCGLLPLGDICFHDLPYNSTQTASFLRVRRTAIAPAAFETCPGREALQ